MAEMMEASEMHDAVKGMTDIDAILIISQYDSFAVMFTPLLHAAALVHRCQDVEKIKGVMKAKTVDEGLLHSLFEYYAGRSPTESEKELYRAPASRDEATAAAKHLSDDINRHIRGSHAESVSQPETHATVDESLELLEHSREKVEQQPHSSDIKTKIHDLYSAIERGLKSSRGGDLNRFVAFYEALKSSYFEGTGMHKVSELLQAADEEMSKQSVCREEFVEKMIAKAQLKDLQDTGAYSTLSAQLKSHEADRDVDRLMETMAGFLKGRGVAADDKDITATLAMVLENSSADGGLADLSEVGAGDDEDDESDLAKTVLDLLLNLCKKAKTSGDFRYDHFLAIVKHLINAFDASDEVKDGFVFLETLIELCQDYKKTGAVSPAKLSDCVAALRQLSKDETSDLSSVLQDAVQSHEHYRGDDKLEIEAALKISEDIFGKLKIPDRRSAVARIVKYLFDLTLSIAVKGKLNPTAIRKIFSTVMEMLDVPQTLRTQVNRYLDVYNFAQNVFDFTSLYKETGKISVVLILKTLVITARLLYASAQTIRAMKRYLRAYILFTSIFEIIDGLIRGRSFASISGALVFVAEYLIDHTPGISDLLKHEVTLAVKMAVGILLLCLATTPLGVAVALIHLAWIGYSWWSLHQSYCMML